MSIRTVLALVVAAYICAHAYGADWGMNGTMTATKSSAFVLTTPTEAATSISASRAILGQNMWIMTYNSTTVSSGTTNRMTIWQIVMGDKPANAWAKIANPNNVLAPPATGCMTTLGYIFEDAGGNKQANVLSTGGIPINGVRATSSVNNAVAVVDTSIASGVNDLPFPDLPVGRSHGIAELDSTAPLLPDTGGSANASIFIYGGEYDGGVTGSMLRMHSPAGSAIPDGWTEITPIGPHSPEPRSRHAGVSIGNQWYVFGGQNGSHVFGDMWVFDFTIFNWTLLHDFGTVPMAQANQPWATDIANQTLPKLPPARYGHSMTILKGAKITGNSNDLILLSSGTNSHSYFNDVWAYDPLYRAWEHITLPETFAPRAYAALIASHNESYAWIYGGNNDDTVFSDVWTLDFTVPNPPGPSFKSLPNNIIAGVAGGILLVLIITVVVLKVTDRNSS